MDPQESPKATKRRRAQQQDGQCALTMWATSFALKQLTPEEEARMIALTRKAVR